MLELAKVDDVAAVEVLVKDLGDGALYVVEHPHRPLDVLSMTDHRCWCGYDGESVFGLTGHIVDELGHVIESMILRPGLEATVTCVCGWIQTTTEPTGMGDCTAMFAQHTAPVPTQRDGSCR